MMSNIMREEENREREREREGKEKFRIGTGISSHIVCLLIRFLTYGFYKFFQHYLSHIAMASTLTSINISLVFHSSILCHTFFQNHCVTVVETIISSGEGIGPFPKTNINPRKENWVSRVESPPLSVGFLFHFLKPTDSQF